AMGNVVSASIPTQILPVEAYICDISEMQFVQSMGSTRFMKVARAEHVEGAALVKVFLLHDQSFSIEPYRDQVIRIRDLLSTAYNCCSFKRVYLTPRCAILSRPFQKQTLYDRLSTRPFLIEIEKKWIAFQLFKALAQCEAVEVCHGDLKTQNVLVSSSNWVQITDFASFKPATIPSDDPSYFTFFFDTSRRMSCYLAPERLQPSQELNLYAKLPGEFLDVSKDLTHAMDVFSLGCILVELFTDGQCPFSHEQLIKFKHASDAGAQFIIQSIQEQLPKEMRRMVGLMLSRNPAKRPRASQLLQKYAPSLFPPIFEHFLYNYMNAFRPKCLQPSVSVEEPSQSFISMDSDDVVAKLASDLDVIIEKLVERPQNDAHKEIDQRPAAVLLISLLTSNIRALKSLTSKLEAMKILLRIATIADSSVNADRILPYMMHLLSDSRVQVRSEAVHSITTMLSSLDNIPSNETRLFIDYLFPRLKIVSLDQSVLVRMSLAVNLGVLAETSVKFLRQGARNLTEDLLGGSVVGEGEDNREREERLAKQEMRALHEAVNEIFVNLCGSDNNVKHSLMSRETLGKLCHFFSRQESSDVLLSHMITFLNDKVDWRLRCTFYEYCSLTASVIGRQITFILKSLLQQGLHDYEEFVQLRALWCICSLCGDQLLDKSAIYELLPDTIPFLAHPNEWLRMAAVNILSVLDNTLSVADVHCKLMPLVAPFLTEKLIRLNNTFVVSLCLRPPIPRPIWSYVVDSSPLVPLLEHLVDKRMLIALDGGPDSIYATSRNQQPKPTQLEPYLRRLENLGLNDEFEEKLILFQNVLTKMDSFRKGMGARRTDERNGVLDLATIPNVKLHKFDLVSGDHKSAEVKKSPSVDMNPEWQAMFGEEQRAMINVQPTNSSLSSVFLDGLSAGDVHEADSSAMVASTISNLVVDHSHNFAVRSSECDVMLSRLLAHKRERYLQHQRLSGAHGTPDSTAPAVPLPTSRVGTRLVAQFHEHSDAVNRLCLSPSGSHFASAGNDGLMKIWSVSRIYKDQSAATRADATFSYKRKINSIQFVGSLGKRLAIASDDCRVTVVDAERMAFITTIGFEKDEDGPPVELYASDNVLYVLTHHGSIFCLDCRMPTNGGIGRKPLVLWSHRINNAYGLITSFCVDPVGQNWMCLTSTNRNVILWDLRFGIEVSNWPHPNKLCRMLRCWPAFPLDGHGRLCSEVWTSSSCSGELSRWKLETSQRSYVLWPTSARKPFNYADDKNVTTALATCPLTGRIFTGDSVGALRSWNLLNPKECYYLSGPEKRTPEAISSSSLRSTIKRSTFEMVEVFYEEAFEKKQRSSPALSNSPLEAQVSVCHRSSISDMLCCGEFLISSSRDGVIKVWK
uniref:non-specific serine/threonine protein kinase n=2 Tax=Parascaris univalens TaxID=6257 RepID=A0A914ZQI7_PARUN